MDRRIQFDWGEIELVDGTVDFLIDFLTAVVIGIGN